MDTDPTPVVSDLLDRLRARVEERRASGAYPPGLEHDLDVHFRHIVEHRPIRNLDALHKAMATFEEGLRFDAARIPTGSRLPGGQVLHQAAAKLTTRQTDWMVEQVREFAESVRVMLWTMIATLDDPTHVHAELTAQIDAILDRLAYYERSPADSPMLGSIVRRLEELEAAEARRQPHPWYAAERFAEEFQGSRPALLEAYRPLAERLAGAAPVADLGCGRGELLELLAGLGVAASGVEADAELAKAAAGMGLRVDHDDAVHWLAATAPESLGGIALLAVAESLSAQQLLDVVALAAEKLRRGGLMVVTPGPGERDPRHQRSVHPAYLTFLFREAGFADVTVDVTTVTATR